MKIYNFFVFYLMQLLFNPTLFAQINPTLNIGQEMPMENNIFIDVGANIGEISEYVEKKCKAKVYSYEPHPTAFIFLKKRFINNKNIKLFNLAVSNSESSEIDFYLHKREKVR